MLFRWCGWSRQPGDVWRWCSGFSSLWPLGRGAGGAPRQPPGPGNIHAPCRETERFVAFFFKRLKSAKKVYYVFGKKIVPVISVHNKGETNSNVFGRPENFFEAKINNSNKVLKTVFEIALIRATCSFVPVFPVPRLFSRLSGDRLSKGQLG